MNLKEEIKPIIGNRRKFLLLRIADVEVTTAREICGIKKGTYNSWLQDEKFVTLYRRRDEFSSDYKQEAIQLLRRSSQLAATLLEEQIIGKMREEIATGEYVLIKTNLAREVYSKLIADLDILPQSKTITWEERMRGILLPGQEQLPEGVVEGQIVEQSKTVTVTEETGGNQES